METTFFDYPYPHVYIEDILTDSENKELYDMCIMATEPYQEQIKDLTFFILDDDKHLLEEKGLEWCLNYKTQNNVGITELWEKSTHDTWDVYKDKIKRRLYEIIDQNQEVYPRLDSKMYYHKTASWHLGLVITADLEDKSPLRPHTDWRYHILDQMGYGKLTKETETEETFKIDSGGYYKGLIYLGDSNLDYKDYGTRIYRNDYTHEQPDFHEVKEIPHIPGNGVLFKTTENSYHGTEFKSGMKNLRYSIVFEYY